MKNCIAKCETSQIVTIRDELLKKQNPIRLESGEPYFDTDSYIVEAANKALVSGKTHYVNSQGILELREALIDKLWRENSIHATTDEIIMTNGGMHALSATLSCLLNKNDEVIIPNPNWTCVQQLITMIGAKVVQVDLQHNNKFKFDWDLVRSKITNKTKAILLNSPHNPTGMTFNEEDHLHIAKLSDEYPDLFIIADEAYEHIHYDGYNYKSLASYLTKNVISIFTFSKSYCMTGWRLGYIVTKDKDLMKLMKKYVLYTSNGISTASQYGGLEAITDKIRTRMSISRRNSEYVQNRDILVDAINDSLFLELADIPKGAFYLFPKITIPDVGWTDLSIALNLINNYELGCIPGSAFGKGGYLRFSYAGTRKDVERASEIIKNIKEFQLGEEEKHLSIVL